MGTVIEPRLCVTPESSCETGPRPSKWGRRRLSNESGAHEGAVQHRNRTIPVVFSVVLGDSLWRSMRSILMVQREATTAHPRVKRESGQVTALTPSSGLSPTLNPIHGLPGPATFAQNRLFLDSTGAASSSIAH